MTPAGVRIVSGSPTDTEVVALIAGLATVASAAAEPDDQHRGRVRWLDPVRRPVPAPLSRTSTRGEDEWRWSLR